MHRMLNDPKHIANTHYFSDLVSPSLRGLDSLRKHGSGPRCPIWIEFGVAFVELTSFVANDCINGFHLVSGHFNDNVLWII